MKRKQTVFVGLSGGVDSSVAALRLLRAGYNVVGVFIKVWQPEFLDCNWEAERLDAMRVAAALKIPFRTFDAETAYKEEVAHYFIEEYKAGRTPNPDVMCNRHVKFGAFLEYALKEGADFIATGHYARNEYDSQNGIYKLLRGVDSNKDQTYFLWTLTQEQLKYVLLPVGDTVKEDIRKEAEKAQLPTAKKNDSQGVCFLGHVDIKEFLSHFTELKTGQVLSADQEVIGSHDGALIYTLGQRHGFTLTNHNTGREALYVIDRNIKNNTITVAEQKPLLKKSEELVLNEVMLTGNETSDLSAQFRYRQQPFPVSLIKKDEVYTLALKADVERPAVGQSCVFYQGQWCVGGGIIAS